jgi:hypothetical protein
MDWIFEEFNLDYLDLPFLGWISWRNDARAIEIHILQ